MVEHAAVNRRVVGSSPTRGAKTKPRTLVRGFVVYGVGCPANGRRLPTGLSTHRVVDDSLSGTRGAILYRKSNRLPVCLLPRSTFSRLFPHHES